MRVTLAVRAAHGGRDRRPARVLARAARPAFGPLAVARSPPRPHRSGADSNAQRDCLAGTPCSTGWGCRGRKSQPSSTAPSPCTLAVVYVLAAGIIHFASQTEDAVALIPSGRAAGRPALARPRSARWSSSASWWPQPPSISPPMRSARDEQAFSAGNTEIAALLARVGPDYERKLAKPFADLASQGTSVFELARMRRARAGQRRRRPVRRRGRRDLQRALAAERQQRTLAADAALDNLAARSRIADHLGVRRRRRHRTADRARSGCCCCAACWRACRASARRCCGLPATTPRSTSPASPTRTRSASSPARSRCSRPSRSSCCRRRASSSASTCSSMPPSTTCRWA